MFIPGVDALRSFDELLLSRPGTLGDRPGITAWRSSVGQEVRITFWGGLRLLSTIFVLISRKSRIWRGKFQTWTRTSWPARSLAYGIGGLATNYIALGIRRRKKSNRCFSNIACRFGNAGIGRWSWPEKRSFGRVSLAVPPDLVFRRKSENRAIGIPRREPKGVGSASLISEGWSSS